MAVSFVNKNKNLISKAVKELKRTKKYLTNIVITLNLTGGAHISFNVGVENKSDIRVVEDKSKVYLGIDLSHPRVTFPRGCSTWDEEIFNIFTRTIRYYTTNVLAKKFYADGITIDDIIADNKVLTEHPLYIEAMDKYRDTIDNGKAEITLRDGEWPRLTDRKLLPLIVIDKESGEGDYMDNRYGAKSYRTDRKKFSIYGASGLGAIAKYVSGYTSEYGLCDITVSNK